MCDWHPPVLRAGVILPAVSEIWLQVKQQLTGNSRPLSELAGCIATLLSPVSFYLFRTESNNDKNRILH